MRPNEDLPPKAPSIDDIRNLLGSDIYNMQDRINGTGKLLEVCHFTFESSEDEVKRTKPFKDKMLAIYDAIVSKKNELGVAHKGPVILSALGCLVEDEGNGKFKVEYVGRFSAAL